jgi:hypothetical protein
MMKPTSNSVFTPVSRPVQPRFHQVAVGIVLPVGERRSIPAEIGSSRPVGRARPVAPREHPADMSISSSASPLEPAQEPVDGTSPD